MGVKVGVLIDLNSLPGAGKWEEHLQLIHETILERLVLDASVNRECDASDLLWTYTFFHSAHAINKPEYGKKFLPFTLQGFQDFELILEKEMRPVYEGVGLNPEHRIEHLGSALMNLMSALRWSEDDETNKSPKAPPRRRNKFKSSTHQPENVNDPEPDGSSVVTAQSSYGAWASAPKSSQSPYNRNIIYVFTRVPRTDPDIHSYLGEINYINKKMILNSSERLIGHIFLPGFLEKGKLQDKHPQVKFVDTGYYFEDNGTAFNNIYPFPLQTALSTLGYAGCLVPTLKPYDHGRVGFPSWKTFLKKQLHPITNSDYNIPRMQLNKQPEKKDRVRGGGDDASSNVSYQTISSHSSSCSAKKVVGLPGLPGRGMVASLMQGKIKNDVRKGTQTDPRERRLRPSNRYSLQNSLGLGLDSASSATRLNSSHSKSFIDAQNPKRHILVAQSSKYSRFQEDKRVEVADVRAKSNYSFTAPVQRPSPSKRVRRNLFSGQSSETGGFKGLGLGLGVGKHSLSRYSTSATAGSFSSRSPSASTSFRSPIPGVAGISYNSFGSPSTSSHFLTSPLGSRISASPQSRFSKSPLGISTQQHGYVSPRTNSTLSRLPSAKRRLTLDELSGGSGPSLDSLYKHKFPPELGFHGVICPESPATPPQKRLKPSSLNSSSSCEKREVLPESPETFSGTSNRESSSTVETSTFYGKTTNAKAWERAGKQIEAARIKDSVRLDSLHNKTSSLSLDDLDFFPSRSFSSAEALSSDSLPPPPQTPVKNNDLTSQPF